VGERIGLHNLSSLARWMAARSVLAPLAGVIFLLALLVSPLGEFPLNDDWIYARMVENLLKDHTLAGHPLSQAFALASTLWGACFALVFGFSYSVLRISTLVLAVVALWATARGAIVCGLSRGAAFLAAIAVLGNPIFLNLAYTFMTDVPALAAIALAGWRYLCALRDGRARDIAMGGAFVALAFTIRQFALLIAVAYVIAEAAAWARGRRVLRLRHVLAFFLPLAAGAGLYWFRARSALTFWPPDTPPFTVGGCIKDALWLIGVCLEYLGLFTLPLACGRFIQLLYRRRLWTPRQWMAFPWVCLGILFLTGGFEGAKAFWIWPMPHLKNILYDLGTGPRILRNPDLVQSPLWDAPSAGAWWWLITALCVGAAALMLVEVIPSLRRVTAGGYDAGWMQRLFLAIWAGCVLLFPYHILIYFSFDRYLLPALPPLVILAALALDAAPGAGARMTAWVLAALCLMFSLACVQDYLAWNRARWQGIAYLRTEKQAAPEQIDGGYEFNGLFTSEESMRRSGATSYFDQGPFGFWVIDDAYAVGFQPRRGFIAIAKIPYFSWLGMTTREILVLERLSRRP